MSQQVIKLLKNRKWKVLEKFFFYKDKLLGFLILSLLMINVYDILYHFILGELNTHQIIEAFLIFIIVIFLLALKIVYFIEIQFLEKNIMEYRSKIDIYKKKYKESINGIKKGIEEQMDLWKLTKEEKKVAKLLILGYSFKQISGILNKKEKTIRNQSLSIYKKSGMLGRNDLAGYFFYDFLELDEV
ncbi:MAG: helix-turn-helix transcriptional regulator [Leptonema sp. (in: bacteria)]